MKLKKKIKLKRRNEKTRVVELEKREPNFI